MGHCRGDPLIFPDVDVARRAVKAFEARPISFGMDWGITRSGKTLLVEVNDGFSLGNYGLRGPAYTALIESRWRQLLGLPASVSLDDFSDVERAWLTGAFAKVCCRVNSEEELMDLYDKAKDAGLEVHLITDSGRTEFHGVPTRTCLVIGPDISEKIDALTGHLELL
jgi:peptidyl-tRNA hydrolase